MPLIPTPRRELIAAGAVTHRVDDALRAGNTVAPFRGVHVDAAHALSFRSRIRAALATQSPHAIAAMQTSAALLLLRWLPESWSADDAVIQVADNPPATHRQRTGLRLHERTLEPEDRVIIDGIPCMSETRTLVELARDPKMPPLLVVQILDGALRDKRTTLDELWRCVHRFPGERGIARARQLIGRAREGVNSPQETGMRLMLEDGGITGLDVDIEVSDDEGLVLARGDLGIKRLLIWGEYDGYVPHSGRDVFRSDRVGDRWLHRRGWHVMRFTDEDLRRPQATCREWLAAIADAPARIRALDPRRSPEIAEAWKALGFS